MMLTFSAVSTVIVAYTLWSWQNPSKEALERLKNPKNVRTSKELKFGIVEESIQTSEL